MDARTPAAVPGTSAPGRQDRGDLMHAMRIVLIVLFAAGNAVLLPSAPFWYLQTAFCGFFLVIAWLSLIRSVDGFYVLCAGEPAVLLAGTVSPWGALALQLLLVAILADSTGFLRSARDGAVFALFCLLSAGVTAWVLTFRHVPPPLVILAVTGVAVVTLCWIAEYRYTARFRRGVP
jgi:hypothetical protein